VSNDSVWLLRFDVVWVLALLNLASASRKGEPTPEVHLFLSDRYWRLAEYHSNKRAVQRAKRLRAKAEYHLRLGGWDPLPPAVAMAMPVPSRPTFTEAIGWRIRRIPPDDAA